MKREKAIAIIIALTMIFTVVALTIGMASEQSEDKLPKDPAAAQTTAATTAKTAAKTETTAAKAEATPAQTEATQKKAETPTPSTKVAAGNTELPDVVTQVEPVNAISAQPGTEQGALGLPGSLRATAVVQGAAQQLELPVTGWQSSPGYHKDVPGEYTFTPEVGKLPYQLGGGVELPQVRVVVEAPMAAQTAPAGLEGGFTPFAVNDTFSVDDFDYNVTVENAPGGAGDNVVEITGYTGSATALSIPTTVSGNSASAGTVYQVTTIGNGAFSGNTGLTSVTFSSALTAIGDNAFNSCSSLATLRFLGSTPPTVGSGAFSGLPAGGSLEFPGGANYTGFGASDLDNWTTSDMSAPSFAETTDQAVSGVENGDITLTVTPSGSPTPDLQWQDSADGGMNWNDISGENTASLNLTNLQVVSPAMQYRCLATNDMGNATSGVFTLTVQGKMVVNNIEYIETAPGAVTVVGATAGTSAIDIPATMDHSSITYNVVAIADGAFANNSDITSLTLSNATNLTSIGKNAFQNVAGLTGAVAFPASLSSIGESAFEGTGVSGQLSFPAGLTDIGARAFAGLSGIHELEFTSAAAPNVAADAFDGIAANGTVTFPSGATGYDPSTFAGGSLTGWIFGSLTAPSFSLQPQDAAVAEGGNVTFTVAADGFPAPTLQWQESTDGGGTWSDMTGETGATLTLTGVSAAMDGYQYRCQASNGVPSDAESNAVTLTVRNTIAAGGLEYIILSDVVGDRTMGLVGRDSGTTVVNVPAVVNHLSEDYNVVSIAESAFESDNAITGIDLSSAANLTDIGAKAFKDTGISGTIAFPAGLTSIGAEAFANNSGINGLEFSSPAAPNVATDAFDGIAASGTVTFPSGATGYDPSTFAGGSLAAWTFGTLTAPSFSLQPQDAIAAEGDIISFTVTADGFPAPALQWQESTDGGGTWSDKAGETSDTLTLPAATATMDGYQYRCLASNGVLPDAESSAATLTVRTASDKDGVKYIILNEDLMAPENNTVRVVGAVNLNDNIVIPATVTLGANTYRVTEIGELAFNGANPNTVDLSGATNLVSIGKEAFYSSSTLTGGIVIPGSVQTIGEAAFGSCGQLSSLDLSGATSLQFIGKNAFNGCSNLAGTLTIPGGVVTLDEGAFHGCKFDGVDFSGATGLTAIGAHAFEGCNQLSGTLALPSSVSSIGDFAFTGTSYTAADLSNLSLSALEANTFEDCYQLTTVTLPASLSALGNEAFKNAGALNMLIFKGSTAPTLGTDVFAGCSSAGTVKFPAGATGYVQGTFGTPDLDGWTFAEEQPLNSAPTFLTHPADATKQEGESATFTVVVSGVPVPTLQWRVSTDGGGSWNDIPGETGNDLTISAIEAGWDGNQYQCVATNTEGSATSNAATLTVDSSGLVYSQRTMNHAGSGISVTGQFTANSTLTVAQNDLHPAGSCPACDAMRKEDLLAQYNISANEHKGDGVRVTIPVGNTFNGRTVTVLHCHNNTLERKELQVSGGAVSGDFAGLSPYAVVRPATNPAGQPADPNAANNSGGSGGGTSSGGGGRTGDASPIPALLFLTMAAGALGLVVWQQRKKATK